MLLGILIPLISTILPINSALQKTLATSLNTTRVKADGILITISDGQNNGPMILIGGGISLYGCLIYLLLPYALINVNLTLILSIFSFILLGMLTGLTLIAYNF